MSTRMCLTLVAAVAVWMSVSVRTNATGVTDFDDIRFWAGTGENRAALVVDWDHTSATDQSLVWGYRWDGAATGEEMLWAIVQADARLYLRHGADGTFGLPIYGFGYDENNDGQFAITTNVSFTTEGFAETSVPDQPPRLPAEAANENDRYAEGFFTGFWHYATSAGSPFGEGEWTSSDEGLTSRDLSDGDWDGWTYETPASLTPAGFPETPIAATAPFSPDYDADGDVDGTDLLLWQRDFASGLVDADDLAQWQQAYGNQPPPHVGLSIPEPSSLVLCFVSIVLLGIGLRDRHCTSRS